MILHKEKPADAGFSLMLLYREVNEKTVVTVLVN